GAGVSGIFLTRTCVDITNPKVIRGTMGSIYRVPFFYVEDVPSLKEMLKGRGILFFAAHLQGRNQYYEESRSEEHTSELQSRFDLVCRLLLEKKKIYI